MAIYRLHRKEWDKSFPPPQPIPTTSSSSSSTITTTLTSSSSSPSTLSPLKRKRSLDASDKVHPDNTHTSDTTQLKTGSEEASYAHADKNNVHSSPIKKNKKKVNSESSNEVSNNPGGGRKGISSGLSTIIKHNHSKRIDHPITKSSSSLIHLGKNKKRRGRGSLVKSEESSGWWKKLGEGSDVGRRSSDTIRRSSSSTIRVQA